MNLGQLSPSSAYSARESGEALDGNPQALVGLHTVGPRLLHRAMAPVDQIRYHLRAGIVEVRFGSKLEAERRLRCALAIQEREMSRQPDIGVEIDVR